MAHVQGPSYKGYKAMATPPLLLLATAERQDTYLAVDHCLFSFYDCFGNQLP